MGESGLDRVGRWSRGATEKGSREVEGRQWNERWEPQRASEMAGGGIGSAGLCVYKFQMSPSAVTKESVGFRTQAPLLTLLHHHGIQGKHEIKKAGVGVRAGRGVVARDKGSWIQ